MKKIKLILSILLFYFFSITLTSCKQENVSPNQLVKRQGLYYKINSQNPYSGKLVDYHNNGQYKLKENYKDGYTKGPFEKYYENGQLQEKGNYQY
jgi:antitoxin component YwqK of YwqJK toxin-antitoxin module